MTKGFLTSGRAHPLKLYSYNLWLFPTRILSHLTCPGPAPPPLPFHRGHIWAYFFPFRLLSKASNMHYPVTPLGSCMLCSFFLACLLLFVYLMNRCQSVFSCILLPSCSRQHWWLPIVVLMFVFTTAEPSVVHGHILGAQWLFVGWTYQWTNSWMMKDGEGKRFLLNISMFWTHFTCISA